MSQIAGLLQQPKSHEWETPIELFRQLDQEFGFQLDAAATEANHLCPFYLTEREDGLVQAWTVPTCLFHGVVFATTRETCDETVYEVQAEQAGNAGALSSKQQNDIGLGFLVSGMQEGQSSTKAGGATGGSRGTGEGAGREASLSAVAGRASEETARFPDRKPKATAAGNGCGVGLVGAGLGGHQSDVGTRVRILRDPAIRTGTRSFYPYLAPRLHGDASREHSAGLLRMQSQEGEGSPSRLPLAGTVCPRCGVVTEQRPTTVWLNPPYGNQIGRWVEKGYEEAQNGATVVMLIPARTETRYWHDYVMRAAEIRFIRGRLRFSGATVNAPFPSAVVVFRAGDHTPRITTMEAPR